MFQEAIKFSVLNQAASLRQACSSRSFLIKKNRRKKQEPALELLVPFNYLVIVTSSLLLSLLATTLLDLSPPLVDCADSSSGGQIDQTLFKYNDSEKSPDWWTRAGRLALDQALRYRVNTQRAKNSIIFIGDGMSLTTITAARILYGQLLNKSGEEEQLAFDKLNNVALIKTYNVDQQVPDSAATATAILCGVKTNFYTLGVNANVKLNDTNCQRIQQNHVHSIIKQAIDAGKSTGIITNTRITHATPASAYAHVSNRRWECDSYVPKNLDAPCKDIARQLIEDEPGSRINVIMGGGRRCFFNSSFQDPGPENASGMRKDGRNLINDWIDQKRANHELNYAFVNSTRDLRLVDVAKTDYLLGLFSYSHMNYEELRDVGPNGEPSLTEMTEVAIKILSKNPEGYVLLVEGGRIDHAHHENVAGVALRETIALSWAVDAARKMINPRDTLLAVTSDHAHALTMNGLAPRGNPILGLSRFKENSTQTPYTTLIYGNGPGHHAGPRRDPTQGLNSSDSPYHVQYAAIHQEEAFHDGSDVGIFASGPYAHLFQGVQEQSYIAHVFAYSMCIGDYTNQPHCRTNPRDTLANGGNSIATGASSASDPASSSRRASFANSNNNNNNNNFNPGNPNPSGGFGRSNYGGSGGSSDDELATNNNNAGLSRVFSSASSAASSLTVLSGISSKMLMPTISISSSLILILFANLLHR